MPNYKVNGVNFASLFGPDDVLCRTSITDKKTLIHEMLRGLAYRYGIGNVDDVLRLVLDREEKLSTLIGPGIAVPHTRIDTIDRLLISVATSEQGIPFGEPLSGQAESNLAHVIILILAPKSQPGAYLQAVSSFAKILQQPNIAQRLAAVEGREDVQRFFERDGLILPEHICAGDVMDRNVVSLRDNDTLERAIDTLVDHNLIDLPVVDAEGKLVGVVTAYKLLKVCLPDYILWMEDLSPIINFEPFAQILKNESSTWLNDIMSLDYVAVPADAPAIEVAKEMTRRGVREVFVVEDEKCVGVITIQDFINKVLRE
jgi:PTS system nitrogen regulatory IIA component